MFAAIKHKIQFHEFDTGSAYGVLVHPAQHTIIVLRFWKEIATKTRIYTNAFVSIRTFVAYFTIYNKRFLFTNDRIIVNFPPK